MKSKRKLRKCDIGSIYVAIDPQLKGYRADNAYRMIDNMLKVHKKNLDTPMTYYKAKLIKSSTTVSEAPSTSNPHYAKRNVDRRDKRKDKKIHEMQEKLHTAKKQIQSLELNIAEATTSLTQATTNLEATTAQLEAEQKAFSHYQTEYAYEELALHETVARLTEENQSLQENIVQMEKELNTIDGVVYCEKHPDAPQSENFVINTTSGKRYSNGVRELYYKLLTMQITPGKISDIIKYVLKSMTPSVDVESLKLPKRSAALYMRSQELPTVNDIQKATVLSNVSQKHLNTDGTTLNQKKLNCIAINDICLSVGEVPDGTADSVVEHIDRELNRLQQLAYKLKLNGAKHINWTCISSSSSDGASTQKRVNKLIEERRARDREKYGEHPGENPTTHLVQNFCGMHLGVNLRKAQNAGVREFYKEASDDTVTERHYEPGDRLVHEFCKVFGKCGTPEYGHGVLNFPDFLITQVEENENSLEYQQAATIKLQRQVGNRYFVTASNSARAFFLAPMAVEYLQQLSSTKVLNRLEQDVLKKLKSPSELAQLKLDGLFFYHIYADLMMLIKSTFLSKNVLDMNTHYLELQTSLQEFAQYPEQVLNPDYQVFPSEAKLYTNSKTTNHRKHKDSMIIYKHLLSCNEWDKSLLFPRIAAAAIAMKEKLTSYKKDQLPGGRYWAPDDNIKEVLRQLKPHNDICESLLGLNDWLPLVNAKQHTKSALVEGKRNKTMAWLETVDKHKVIDLAVSERRAARKRNQEIEKEVQYKRIKRHKNDLEKAKQKEIRAKSTIEKFESIPLIKSEQELEKAIQDIEEKRLNNRQCQLEKMTLIKNLLRQHATIRKQKVVPFSVNRKPKTFYQLKADYISLFNNQEHIPAKKPRLDFTNNPELMVGNCIKQKFIEDGCEQWYEGYVHAYDPKCGLHEVVYNGESKHYFYNLLEDLEDNSLIIN